MGAKGRSPRRGQSREAPGPWPTPQPAPAPFPPGGSAGTGTAGAWPPPGTPGAAPGRLPPTSNPLETPIPPAPLVWDPDEPKRKRGRPTIFETHPEAWPRLIWAIRQGNTFQAAAGFAGISRGVLAKLLRRGRQAQAEGEVGPWADFMKAIDESVASSEVLHVGYITLAARKGAWKASAFLLQTRNPKRWAPASKLALTGGDFKGDAVFEMVLPNTRPAGGPLGAKGPEPVPEAPSDPDEAYGGDDGDLEG